MKFKNLFILFIILLTAICCKDKNPNDDKVKKLESELTKAENKIQTLEKDSVQKHTNKKAENLVAYGSFFINEEKLHLSIPVANERYTIIEEVNISSNDINALLVRISDSTENSMIGLPVKHTIVKKYDLNRLGLSMGELEEDKKLIVITLNSTDEIQDTDLNSLRACIDDLDDTYDAEACENSITRIKKPNDKKGSIIFGFN